MVRLLHDNTLSHQEIVRFISASWPVRYISEKLLVLRWNIVNNWKAFRNVEMGADSHMSMRQTLISNALMEWDSRIFAIWLKKGRKQSKAYPTEWDSRKPGRPFRIWTHSGVGGKVKEHTQMRAHSILSIRMTILNQQKSFSDRNREKVANKGPWNHFWFCLLWKVSFSHICYLIQSFCFFGSVYATDARGAGVRLDLQMLYELWCLLMTLFTNVHSSYWLKSVLRVSFQATFSRLNPISIHSNSFNSIQSMMVRITHVM